MLKIKDDVNLKELEKFGFNYYDDKKSCYYGCCSLIKKDLNIFINNARTITITSDKSVLELNVLYDLIQARISRESE